MKAADAQPRLKDSTDLEEGGEAELGWLDGAVGVQGHHVDDEGSLRGALALDKGLSIGKSRVEGDEPSAKECVEHRLYEGAVGGLLWGCAGIRQEEAPGGQGQPDVGRDGNTSGWSDALGGEGVVQGVGAGR